MAAIAPWVSLVSVSLNAGFVAIGAAVIARRGGWAYLRGRFGSREQAIYQSPYYNHRHSQFDRLPISPSDIMFLGDSITDEGEWSDWFPAATIRNRGISGDTIGGVLRRLPNLLKGAPKAVFLMIGINDLINVRRSPEQVLACYEQILSLVKQQTPQTQVYVQSVLPIAAPFPSALNQTILQLNQGIAALATSFGYRYVDLHGVFVVNGQLDPACTTDGLHLNGEGYARWASHLRPLIHPTFSLAETSLAETSGDN
jgi:lysophospholipase L1-like esterase